VARVIHLVESDDVTTKFKILKLFKNYFLKGSP
jgi:hypothetical protein